MTKALDTAIQTVSFGHVGLKYIGVIEGEWGADFVTEVDSKEYFAGLSNGLKGRITLRIGKENLPKLR